MKLNSKTKEVIARVTPERIKEEVRKLGRISLPPELQKRVREYNEVGERDPLVWPLIFRFIEIVNFSSVPRKYQPSLLKARFLSTMLVVLVDDIVDKARNKRLREELLSIPLKGKKVQLEGLSRKERSYLEFTLSIWQNFFELVKKYPRYQMLEEIFYFDILQIFNSMRFSALINDNPYLINMDEYWGYLPSSMQLMVHHTLNSMCSTRFNIREVGAIRKIVWHAQYMLRIGNCLSTWQREIKEKDYSNGIFAYLVDKGRLSVESLIGQDISIDKKDIARVENYFFDEWEKHYNCIKELAPKVKSFNVKIFISQLEKVLVFHLSIRNI